MRTHSIYNNNFHFKTKNTQYQQFHSINNSIQSQKHQSLYSDYYNPTQELLMDFDSFKQNQNRSQFVYEKDQRSRARESRLRNMRRYHSEKLLRQFTRQVKQLESNDYEDVGVDERIKKLQGAVQGLILVKQLIQNPEKQYSQQSNFKTIIDNYQNKLNQKDQYIRQLKRKLQQLLPLSQQNKLLLNDSFGSLQQQHQGYELNYDQQYDHRRVINIPHLSIGDHDSQNKQQEQSILIEDKYIVQYEDFVANDDYVMGQNYYKQEVTSRGYETGRFGTSEQFSPVRMNVQDRLKMSACLSIIIYPIEKSKPVLNLQNPINQQKRQVIQSTNKRTAISLHISQLQYSLIVLPTPSPSPCKSLLKISLTLLMQKYKAVSLRFKYSQSQFQKLLLSQTKIKIIQFVNNFNKAYYCKTQSLEQNFWQSNIKQLKEIQDILITFQQRK